MLNPEELPTPIGPQILEIYDSELFQETHQNSDEHHLSNTNTHNFNKYNRATADDNDEQSIHNLSMLLLGSQIDNISDSIDFSTASSFSGPQQGQYNIDKAYPEPLCMATVYSQTSSKEAGLNCTARMPNDPPLLTTGFEEECLSCMPSDSIHLRNDSLLGNNCSVIIDPLVGPCLPPSGMSAAPFPSCDISSGILTGGGGLVLGPEFSRGDNGRVYLPATYHSRVFNCSSGDLQALSSESQEHVLHRSPSSTTLASEMSGSLEDLTFVKVGRLSPQERKRKIERYLKKRNQRNFTKKIKYACRKTLADSRPRVRGRFAKSDEVGELARTTCSNHEDSTDDQDHVSEFCNSIPDYSQHHKVVKGKDLEASSGIFVQKSGVNSLKCNYPIQSWI